MNNYSTYDEQGLFRAAVGDSKAKEVLRERTHAHCLTLVSLYKEKYKLHGTDEQLLHVAMKHFDYAFDRFVRDNLHVDMKFYFIDGYTYVARREMLAFSRTQHPVGGSTWEIFVAGFIAVVVMVALIAFTL